MAYVYSSPLDLSNISKSIRSNSASAENDFKMYIDNVIGNTGNYAAWDMGLCLAVYEFGELYKKTNPSIYIQYLDEKINTANIEDAEFLYFMKSDIVDNFWDDDKKYEFFMKCLDMYPANAEFYTGVAKCHAKNEQWLKAIEYTQQASQLGYKDKSKLNNYLFNVEIDYVNSLLVKKEYEKALGRVDLLKEEDYVKYDSHYNNITESTRHRVKDNREIDNKIISAKREINDYIKEEYSKERTRQFELIGVFTAIIALIFSTVTLSSGVEFKQSLVFIIALGLVLLLFVNFISFFTRPEFEWLSDSRFFITLISVISLAAILNIYL